MKTALTILMLELFIFNLFFLICLGAEQIPLDILAVGLKVHARVRANVSFTHSRLVCMVTLMVPCKLRRKYRLWMARNTKPQFERPTKRLDSPHQTFASPRAWQLLADALSSHMPSYCIDASYPS